jgi:hypothetical protein
MHFYTYAPVLHPNYITPLSFYIETLQLFDIYK